MTPYTSRCPKSSPYPEPERTSRSCRRQAWANGRQGLKTALRRITFLLQLKGHEQGCQAIDKGVRPCNDSIIRNVIPQYETGTFMVRPNNLVQTIERVAAILDLVGEAPQGVSIRELSAQLGLAKGTVHRLLASLSYVGYIRQDAVSRNYFLGFKLLDLAGLVGSQLDLRTIAGPLLRDLADRTQETVHMVVWDQGEVVYIEKDEPPLAMGGLRMASRVGARNPAHSCAVGKALLSHLSDDELGDFVSSKGLASRTPHTITDASALREELSAIRARGYAVDDEENEKGIRCVGAAVMGASGRPVAAISVSGPAFRMTKKVIQEVRAQEVVEVAAEISRRLGYGSPKL
jgi:DNA-binding IclR family transcriptional regulator